MTHRTSHFSTLKLSTNSPVLILNAFTDPSDHPTRKFRPRGSRAMHKGKLLPLRWVLRKRYELRGAPDSHRTTQSGCSVSSESDEGSNTDPVVDRICCRELTCSEDDSSTL